MKIASLLVLSLFIYSCHSQNETEQSVVNITSQDSIVVDKLEGYKLFFLNHSNFIAKSFQFPVGPPDANGYYNAQYFGINLHLGEDWNGVGGGNTDLGDPVFSIAKGYVYEAKDYKGGWGNVVRVIHKLDNPNSTVYVESLYAHLDELLVTKGDSLEIGIQLGTIGNANGAYLAHLHLEIRDSLEMDIGGGYSTDTRGFLDPTDFIRANK